MTNGVVVVLGPTGINVGSGMTGGVGYLYSPSGDDAEVEARLNKGNVQGRRIVHANSPAAHTVRDLIQQHHDATASKHAAAILADFDPTHFVQVVPPSEVDKESNSVLETADAVEPAFSR
mmetsp:Transcript_22153/g.66496  ORF Transcript_22153/g.66496 Transcript_22153/m.66496 type:complete len:120 (-) Transcript_22153:46-405(-)